MKGIKYVFYCNLWVHQETKFSDSIATSDVYPSEDLEYIVQSQRHPGSASDYRYSQLHNPAFRNTYNSQHRRAQRCQYAGGGPISHG